MNWLDHAYDTSVAIPVSLGVLAAIGLLSWRKKGRQIILALTLFLYTRYLLWRGVYTLNVDDWAGLLVSSLVLLAEAYGFVQLMFFTFQAWRPLERQSPPITTYPTVDIMVTVVNEPLEILRRTLVGCTSQEYPSGRYKVYVLDDGHRQEVRGLAGAMGCDYIARQSRDHAKAGNLNHALQQTQGELIAVFDTDHVPTSTFLRETVGFFENERVAIVQTPHHFYNPDIFQKNLRLENELKNEQALFFRTLQPGRDAHNSAFFAGSSGLFRRRPLMEVGGFQTATITEDIHTSMLVHAKGYESRFLNKVLAAGLMPETFGGYLKQRTRWAIGCIQMFLKCNPMTVRGLTFAQRIDYLGSVYYFFHGVPRVICLAAPLSALLLGVSPVHATVADLVHLFGSYFFASLVMMRTVSAGTRNAFWADVYETAMCFSLSKATLATMLRPHKPRAFVVTPKGEKLEKRGIKEAVNVIPHLVLFGLLIAGMAMGIQLWLHDRSTPGLQVSLFWGAVNLFLLTLAILTANELPQWRNSFRLPRRVPCELTAGNTSVSGLTKDLNEDGACIETKEPMLLTSGLVTLELQRSSGDNVALQGMLTRQEKTESGFEVGVSFLEVDETKRSAITAQIFNTPNVWTSAQESQPGIWHSFWSLVTALRSAWHSRRPARRHFPRIAHQLDCDIQFHSRSYKGHTKDISFLGLSVAIDEDFTHTKGPALITIKGMVLKVSLIGASRYGRRTVAQFRVNSVDKGEEQWHALNMSGW
ncbi:MAG TPA: glycosyltransferase [Nitrospiraceae bacterium]